VGRQDNRLAERIEDEFRFFRTWASSPRTMGAVTPSSRAYARRMVELAKPDPDKLVLETGAGTGVVTEVLIESGFPRDKIVSIEFEPHFCELLEERFPGIKMIQGDAYDLDKTLGELRGAKFGAVLSGVPLLMVPKAQRLRYIEDMLGRLAPGAVVTQLSYSLTPPVPEVPGRFTVDKSKWVTFNLPPARVWVYRPVVAR
jgi:phosphatidylethanolamine/phosphatidyl-N-methylethanolamine N-methyltransferase